MWIVARRKTQLQRDQLYTPARSDRRGVQTSASDVWMGWLEIERERETE